MEMLARQLADLQVSVQVLETFAGVQDAVDVEVNQVPGFKLKTELILPLHRQRVWF